MSVINKSHQYSVSEFYLLLKLGIWHCGTVHFWGRTDIIPAGGDFVRSMDLSARYDASSLIRKHLTAGVYLLDIFYMGKDVAGNRHTYRLVIAVCRNDMIHLEALYHLQVCNAIPLKDFLAALDRDDVALACYRMQKKKLFNHPGSIRTSLSPVWPKYVYRR